MRDNLSLLSFWGLVFTLIAVTLFVVVYSYKKSINRGENKDITNYLRRRSVAAYLTAQSSTAQDISEKLRAAADEIERLRAENSVMFWLIIAMNTVVTGLLALAYKIF
jgi:Flp pilus assembly protein TadB